MRRFHQGSGIHYPSEEAGYTKANLSLSYCSICRLQKWRRPYTKAHSLQV